MTGELIRARCLGIVAACVGLTVFFFSSRRRHTSYNGDWSSDVCASDLEREREREKRERREREEREKRERREKREERAEERRVGREYREKWREG